MKRTSLALVAGAIAAAGGLIYWQNSKSPIITEIIIPKTQKTTAVDSNKTSEVLAPAQEKARSSEPRPSTVLDESVENLPAHLTEMVLQEKKALRTAVDEEEYRKLLTDENNISISIEILSNSGSKYADNAERKRMLALSHIARALQYAKGAALEVALQGLENLLVEEFKDGLDPELKKSLAGDKVEAFSLLLQSSPDRAQKVRDKVKGSKLAPLIEYAFARENPAQNHVISQ